VNVVPAGGRQLHPLLSSTPQREKARHRERVHAAGERDHARLRWTRGSARRPTHGIGLEKRESCPSCSRLTTSRRNSSHARRLRSRRPSEPAEGLPRGSRCGRRGGARRGRGCEATWRHSRRHRAADAVVAVGEAPSGERQPNRPEATEDGYCRHRELRPADMTVTVAGTPVGGLGHGVAEAGPRGKWIRARPPQRGRRVCVRPLGTAAAAYDTPRPDPQVRLHPGDGRVCPVADPGEDVTGYDLAALFVGSLGRSAVIRR